MSGLAANPARWSRSARRYRNEANRNRVIAEAMERRVMLAAPASFETTGVGGGGYFYESAISPFNSNDVYLGTDMGELYHNSDGGATFTYPATSKAATNRFVSGSDARVQFTPTAGLLWSVNDASGKPSRSIDGGNTWVDSPTWTGGWIRYLYSDPNDGNFLVAINVRGTNIAISRSTDGGASWTNSGGAAVSSTNLVAFGMYRSGSGVWMGTTAGLLVSSDNGATFNVSTIPGFGAGEVITSFACAQAGSVIRFFVTTYDSSVLTGQYFDRSGCTAANYRGVYTMDWGAAAWTKVSSIPAGTTPTVVGMARNNIDVVYAGGKQLVLGMGEPSVLKSTDGGGSWNETFNTTQNGNIQVGGDVGWHQSIPWNWTSVNTMSVRLNDPNRVIITNMMAAWMTSDGGSGAVAPVGDWKCITVDPAYLNPAGRSANAYGSYAGTTNNISVYNTLWLDPQTIFTSATDVTALRSSNSGRSWSLARADGGYLGNFFQVNEDYRTNALFIGGGQQNDLYTPWRMNDSWIDGKDGGAYYSTDLGKTWSLLKEFTYVLSGSTYNSMVADLVIDPYVAGRAYALVTNSVNGGIFVTNNLYLADGVTPNTAATWSALGVPSRMVGGVAYWARHPADLCILSDGTLVAAFGERTLVSGTMEMSSGIWMSSDGGATWIDRSQNTRKTDGTPVASSSLDLYTQRVYVDPQDASQNTWYATVDTDYSGVTANPGVYKSTDRGVSWRNIFSGDGAIGMAINSDTHEMYVGTSNSGVYYASDANVAIPTLSFLPQATGYYRINGIFFNRFRTSQIMTTSQGGGMTLGDSAPVMPSDLSASPSTTYQAVLNWSPLSGVTSYQVQRAVISTSDGSVTWVPSGTTSGTTWNVTDRPAGEGTYYYRVAPNVGTGVSNIVYVSRFNAMNSLTGIATTSGQADLQWKYVGKASIDGYRIERSDDNGATWSLRQAISGGDILNWSDTGLLASTLYKYRVSATAGNFVSASSSPVTVMTLSDSTLLAYDGFNYTQDQYLHNLSGGSGWADAWCVGRDDGEPIINGSGLKAAAPADALLSGGNSFTTYFGVTSTRNTTTSFGADGTELWSSFLIKPDLVLDGSWTNAEIDFGSIALWCQGMTGNFYFSARTVDGSWNGPTTYAVTPGQAYFVVIRQALNPTGNGQDVLQIWTNPAPGSTPPSVGSAWLNTTLSSTLTAPSSTRVAIRGKWGLAPQYDEIRLGRSYGDVAPLPAAIPVAAPTTPQNLTASVVSKSQIDLSWTDNSDNEVGFYIDRATDSAFGGNLVTVSVGANVTGFSASGLFTATTYYFRIRAYNGIGPSAYTPTASATTLSNPPSDISLAGDSVAENQPAGTVVGTLATTDADTSDTFTYSLVSGAGGDDNASFAISGNELRTAASFDYEMRASYRIRVRSTDSGGLFFEKAFAVTVINVNEAPADVLLSPASIAENRAAGSAVGTLTTNDPDVGDTFTYTLVSGPGSADDESFSISGNQLLAAVPFDYEARSIYSVRVRATDAPGLFVERALAITVTNANETPTDVSLSSASIPENQPAGTVVGAISASDPDIRDTFTYTLVAGIGSADNSSFAINRDRLVTAAPLNHEAGGVRSVRVRATDAGGRFFEKAFAIAVTDLNEAPTGGALSGAGVPEDQPIGTEVGTLTTMDPDSGDAFTYTLASGAGSTDNASFNIVGDRLVTATTFSYVAGRLYSIRVRSTDASGLSAEMALSIQVTALQEFGQVSAKTQSLSVVDGDGDVVTFKLSGGGLGALWGNQVSLIGTTAKSVLTVGVKRGKTGDGQYRLGKLTSDGLIKGISAGNVVLDGDVVLNSLGRVAGKAAAALTFRQISDADIRVQGLTLTSVTVGGSISGTRIVTSATIGTITAAALLGSDILVGVPTGFLGEVARKDDFINAAAKLGSLKVIGKKLPAGQSHPAYVVGSHVSAASVGNVSLVNVPAGSGPLIHVLSDAGVLRVSQTKLTTEAMFGSATWKIAGQRPVIWEVL